MSKETKPELFIRLLADSLVTDRLIRQASWSAQSKATLERFRQLFASDLKQAMSSIEPLKRVHRESPAKAQGLRTG